jgi:hypothetical protein
MPNEVPATLKLYLEDKIEQFMSYEFMPVTPLSPLGLLTPGK